MVFFREILQEPCVVTNHYGTKDFHLNEEATSGNLLAVFTIIRNPAAGIYVVFQLNDISIL